MALAGVLRQVRGGVLGGGGEGGRAGAGEGGRGAAAGEWNGGREGRGPGAASGEERGRCSCGGLQQLGGRKGGSGSVCSSCSCGSIPPDAQIFLCHLRLTAEGGGLPPFEAQCASLPLPRSSPVQKLLRKMTPAPDKAARIPIGGALSAKDAAAAAAAAASALTPPGRKVVVFLSSCDGVELHHRLLGGFWDTACGAPLLEVRRLPGSFWTASGQLLGSARPAVCSRAASGPPPIPFPSQPLPPSSSRC